MSSAELETAAVAASTALTAAELHGTVCGMLVANVRALGLSEGRVQFSVDAYVDLVGADAIEDAESVEDFAALSLAHLDASDMSFSPLLPREETTVSERVEALGEWCAAFLSGLGAVPDTDLGEAEAEVLDDFVAISAVDADVDDSDASERQLTELVEYVRVAVLSLLAPSGEGAE